MSKSNKKFIDLFAGIGGFHLAFHKLGLECVLASEIDQIARESYEKNFQKISPNIFKGEVFNKDIFDLHTDDIPNFDICCAGFPCQPFSQIGKKRGFDENFEGRGNLFLRLSESFETKDHKHFFLKMFNILRNTTMERPSKLFRKELET